MDAIVIIRHGEKPENGSTQGVMPDGQHDIGALTVRGWTRAGALAELIAPGAGSSAAPFARPTHLYAATPKAGGHGLRASQTVAPLAAKLGLKVDVSFGTGDEHGLAHRLAQGSGTALVAWEHTAIRDILKGLGTVTPPPPPWDAARYDMFWILRPHAADWTFQQEPQLVLDHDSSEPIR